MAHLEKRRNTYLAVLTVPQDVRSAIGKIRFVQSTQTGDRNEAGVRAALLVAGWKAQIKKARGKLPDHKADFWEQMRAEYIQAQDQSDDASQFAIEDAVQVALKAVKDQEESIRLWKYTTNQLGVLLAPHVEDWKASLRLAQKTIDQRHRDVRKMAQHFVSVDALQAQNVKAWTDKLIRDGTTASSLERMMDGCRSLWGYLQDAGVIPVGTPDPFAGTFRLATKRATRNTVGRQAFTIDDLARVYAQAKENGDEALCDLIALGAYTGARIEELCSLTLETSEAGVFTITDAKTDAGTRTIPVHPRLKPLVKRLRKMAGEGGFLIPSTAAGQYGVRSDPLSKRFGRLKESLGYGPGHVFHSIRKTAATLLEQAGVPEGIAADILGHEKQTLSYGLYSTGSAMKDKLAAISKLSFPGALGNP